MSISLQLLLVCLFLILSAIYSGSEAMILSIGIDRMMQLIEENGKYSKLIKFIARRSNEFLMMLLIANNIVNVLVTALITIISTQIFSAYSFLFSILITSTVVLLCGEIIPKIVIRVNAERFIPLLFPFLKVNYYLFYPLLSVVNGCISFILGERLTLKGHLVTPNDILYMVNRAEKDKSIESKQIELLNSVLEFPTIKVKDIMLPRHQIKAIDADWSLPTILDFIKRDNHSRYPVYKNKLDNIIGFLHVKNLAFDCNAQSFDINHYIRRAFFVYEHMKIQAVFDYMNRQKVHLSLIKDENNLIVGIITLEDIIEEIFGEIQDEHDDAMTIKSDYNLSTGIVVQGNIPLRDLYNEYDIKINLNSNYSTLSGFLLDILGDRFPAQGQIIVWQQYIFELIKVENATIGQVKIVAHQDHPEGL